MLRRVSASMLLVLLLVMNIPSVATAATPLRVFIDGEEKFFTPAPTVQNSSTLVPMRAFFQSLGASVAWDPVTRSVTSVKGDTTVKLVINSRTALVNDQAKSLSVAAQIIGSSTFIPLRFVGEALGAKVGYANRTITVTSPAPATIAVEAISISPTSLALTVGGETASLSATTTPANAPNRTIQWSSTNTGVATVSASGVVTPISAGTAEIAASIIDQGKLVQAFCPVTVTTKSTTAMTPKEIFAAASPAIVLIETFSYAGTSLGLGSGFIVEPAGKIVTNYHVVKNAYSAKVKLTDGRVFDVAAVLAHDEQADIAILKVEASGLPIVDLGDSSKVENGESVVVIGSPLGLESTITNGLVSSALRTFEDGYQYIQTSAPVSPGNSGGPLLNDSGEVIGVVTWKISSAENLNFAIPINAVLPYIAETGIGKTLPELAAPTAKPLAPTGVWAASINSSQIMIDWDEDPTADYFHVYYSNSSTGTFIPFADRQGNKLQLQWDPKEFSAMLEGIPAGVDRYFKVTTVVNGVESDFSEVVGATTYDVEETLYEEEYNDDYDMADFYAVEFEAEPHTMIGEMDAADFDYYRMFIDNPGTLYVEVYTGPNPDFPGDLLFGIEDENGDLVTYFTTDSDGWIRGEHYLSRGMYYFVLFTDIGSDSEGSYIFTAELTPDN